MLSFAASCTLTIVKLEDGYNMAETEEDISMSHREERKHGKLVIDTATVTLTSKIEFKTSLVAQSDVCWKVLDSHQGWLQLYLHICTYKSY